MHVTVLGAGTVLPSTSRSPSGYLVDFAEERLLFDVGAGTLARLHSAGFSYRDLDKVFISHLHSDHVLDLIALLQAFNATPGWTRTKPLTVLGCQGLNDFVAGIMNLFDGTVPENYELNVIELTVGRHEFPGFVIETALTGHTGNSLAFRLEANDRAFVYSGDAIESSALAELARKADLFACECSFPTGFVTTDHLTADGVGRLASSAAVKRVLLTHLYPNTGEDEVARQVCSVFDGEVIVARDGTAVVIS